MSGPRLDRAAWQRAEPLLDELLELDPAQRETRLSALRDADPELHQVVISLLAGASLEGPLARPAADLAALLVTPAGAPETGESMIRRELSHFRVVDEIGSGGMGVVYRALDLRLGREIALKVLPPELAADVGRRQRLLREARAASALNHPNIVTVHEVGSAGGVDFIAMELVVGRLLSSVVRDHGLPLTQALEYGVQIAEALAFAHDRGIVHRDIKPANLMVTSGERIKVLDFGIAKVLSMPGGETRTTQAPTASGLFLGTPHYASPEQVQGLPVDARSDVFSFGCVLYEMVCGHSPFHGANAQAALASVLRDTPLSPRDARPEVSAELDRLLFKTLEKDRGARCQDMHLVLAELKRLQRGEALSSTLDSGIRPVSPRRRLDQRELLAWTLAGCAALAAGLLWSARTSEPSRAVRAAIILPGGVTVPWAFGMALSPDGTRLAFPAPGPEGGRVLWVRPLAAAAAQPVEGTQDASYPFWSPDGLAIGFFAEGKLKRVSAEGGPPVVITDAPQGRGGAWSRDDTVLFAATPSGASAALQRVAAQGGPSVRLLHGAAGASSPRWPVLLPDGRRYLFVARSGEGEHDRGALYLGDLRGSPARLLLRDTSNAGIDAARLVFVRDGTLLTQPFDVVSGTLAGEPRQLTRERVAYAPIRDAAAFSVAAGVVAYRAMATERSELVWFDRGGRRLGQLGETGAYSYPRLSPDGRRVAVVRSRPDAKGEAWVIESDNGRARVVSARPANYWEPVWSPDSTRLAFSSDADGGVAIYTKTVADNVEPRLIFRGPGPAFADDWSPDGRSLIYETTDARTSQDLWLLSLAGEAAPQRLVASPKVDQEGHLSPDGRWLAHTSNRSGRYEVYVRPFPDVEGGEWQVSGGGGGRPAWRADSRELYYGAREGLTAVEIRPGPRFAAGPPHPLFQLPSEAFDAHDGALDFDVTPDGRRFLVNLPVASTTPAAIQLIFNWTADRSR